MRFAGNKLDLVSLAQKEDDLILAGTFQAALHRKIQDIVSNYFAVLLGHMDRNGGLNLVGERKDNIRALWLYLSTRSMSDLDVYSRSARRNHVEVPSDGSSGRNFQSRFPFSFFLSGLLHSMRVTAESRADTEAALTQQFALLNLEMGLDGELSEALIRRYVYDFTAMHCMYTEKIGRQHQSDIVYAVLTLFNGGVPPRTLAGVHAQFWQTERVIHAYFQLIDSVPDVKDDVYLFLTSQAYTIGYGHVTNTRVAQLVLNSLAPSQQVYVYALRWIVGVSVFCWRQTPCFVTVAHAFPTPQLKLLLFVSA